MSRSRLYHENVTSDMLTPHDMYTLKEEVEE